MFKNEIEFIIDLNISKLNKKSSFFTLDEIKRSKIHPAIIKYIVAHVEQQVFSDIQNLNKNSNFDYSNNKIGKYLKLISEEIKSSKKFNLEEITNLINKAVIFNIGFLTRPNKSITEFIFEKDKRKNINEITHSFLFVYYYKFLPKLVLTYFTRKKIKAISKLEFSILLRKIDSIAKKNHLQGTINIAIDSIANFFDVGPKKIKKIPLETVDLFLKEKGLKQYSKKLNETFNNENNSMYLSIEIKNVLNNTNKQTEFEVGNEAIDIEVSEEQIPNEELLSNNKNSLEEIPDGTLAGTAIMSSDSEKPSAKLKETIVDDSSIVVANEKVETIENLTVEETPFIKPDAKAAIKELVDIDKFYDSLSNEPKPSDNEILKTAITETSNNGFSELTDYKMDNSDLDTEFNTPDETEGIEFQSIYAQDKILVEETTTKEDNIPSEQIKHIENIKEEQITEDPKSKQNTENNFTKNEDIRLTEDISEEITEVFSDITYLEKNEIEDVIEKDISEPEIKTESEIEEDKENILDNSKYETENHEKMDINNEDTITEVLTDTKTATTYKTFSEVVSTNDMSTIIETIFDYDMEDYHDMINNIGISGSESEAIQLVNNYCSKNNINTSILDVSSFKSLISNYYTQHQI